MSETLFYTMGEVAEMFDVNASLIRYWETQFPSLKPHRNKKGNRLFTPADVETLKRVYYYVKECGMTLEGAKKALRGSRDEGDGASSNMELLERLQTLRTMLVAVRDSLGEEVVVEPSAKEPSAPVQQLVVEPKEESPKPQGPIYLEQSLFDF